MFSGVSSKTESVGIYEDDNKHEDIPVHKSGPRGHLTAQDEQELRALDDENSSEVPESYDRQTSDDPEGQRSATEESISGNSGLEIDPEVVTASCDMPDLSDPDLPERSRSSSRIARKKVRSKKDKSKKGPKLKKKSCDFCCQVNEKIKFYQTSIPTSMLLKIQELAFTSFY